MLAARLQLFLCLVLLCTCSLAQTPTGMEISWRNGPEASQDLQYHATAAEGNWIYVAGGSQNGSAGAFDTRHETWRVLPNLQIGRDFPAGAVLHNNFYVAGGIDASHAATSLVECFNHADSSWQWVAQMRMKRSRFVAAAFGDKIYVFGGLDVDSDGTYGNLRSVECYDPTSDSWTDKMPMSVARHGHAATVADGHIYIAGGYTDQGQTDLVEKYDPSTDSWTTCASLPTARGFFGLVAIDRQLYAIGGRVYSDNGPVEQYNIVTNMWTSLTPMAERRNRFGCVAVGRRIYLICAEDAPREVLIGEISQ